MGSFRFELSSPCLGVPRRRRPRFPDRGKRCICTGILPGACATINVDPIPIFGFQGAGTRCPSLFCWASFSGFRTRVYKQFVINGPAFGGGTGYKRKSTVQNESRGYDYPVSIRFRTVLGGFSVFADPAPLARLEIVFAVFDYQAAVRSFAAVPNRRLLRYHKYSDKIPCPQTFICINCPFNSPLFFAVHDIIQYLTNSERFLIHKGAPGLQRRLPYTFSRGNDYDFV